MDRDSEQITEHARDLHIALEQNDLHHPHRARPRGVPFHAARYPRTCDDCGQTYWSMDEWGAHIGCTGSKRRAGF